MAVDPNLDSSDCSVSVRVGSDNGTRPGMAHLIEHLLLMKSIKSDKINGFDLFCTSHNGIYEAETFDDTAIYYF